MTRMTPAHLVWIPVAAGVGFLAAFVLADLMRVPAGIYHPLYFGLVLSLCALYSRKTDLNFRDLFTRRSASAIVLGVAGAVAMTWRVLSEPASAGPSGALFWVDLFWRGFFYGTVDGLLLSALPWIVTWRAFDAEAASVGKKILVSLTALLSIVVVTAAYHLGYPDFRGPKVLQAVLGNVIISVPMLLAMNPLGSVIAHSGLHLAAVVHDPRSTLFLPPH